MTLYETALQELAGVFAALDAGAKVTMITVQPSGRCAPLADFILRLPAQTMADDQSHARLATFRLPNARSSRLCARRCPMPD